MTISNNLIVMQYAFVAYFISLFCRMATNRDDTSVQEFCTRDNKTGLEILNVQLIHPIQPTVVISCFGYDVLKHLAMVSNTWEQFEHPTKDLSVIVQFVNCFNNETNHENYQKFSLISVIDRFINNFTNIVELTIYLEPYGLIDSTVFFRDFNFSDYTSIVFNNTGWWNTEFLQHTMSHVTLINTNLVNFADFTNNSKNTIEVIKSRWNKIDNLTNRNLAKLPNIRILEIRDFDLVDSNALNVPNLFMHNVDLYEIDFEDSASAVPLHESLFNGLPNVTVVRLNNLQIEQIAKILFWTLPKLEFLELLRNNLKRLDPFTFVGNPQLKLVLIDGNADVLRSRDIHYIELPSSCKIRVYDINIIDSTSILPLMQTSYVMYSEFLACSLLVINISDLFGNSNTIPTLDISRRHSPPIRVSLVGPFKTQLKLDSTTKLKNAKYDVHIETLAKYFDEYDLNYEYDAGRLLYILETNLDYFFVYQNESKVLIHLSKAQTGMQINYKFPFTKNCPKPCECFHSLLRDSIYIDCERRMLVTIPIIPYLSQMPPNTSIVLNLNDNLITHVDFVDQDERVVLLLTEVKFERNPIRQISLTVEEAQFKLKLCIVQGTDNGYDKSNITLVIDGVEQLNDTHKCGLLTSDENNHIAYGADQHLKLNLVKTIQTIPIKQMCPSAIQSFERIDYLSSTSDSLDLLLPLN